jgi:hypothetical protein
MSDFFSLALLHEEHSFSGSENSPCSVDFCRGVHAIDVGVGREGSIQSAGNMVWERAVKVGDIPLGGMNTEGGWGGESRVSVNARRLVRKRLTITLVRRHGSRHVGIFGCGSVLFEIERNGVEEKSSSPCLIY